MCNTRDMGPAPQDRRRRRSRAPSPSCIDADSTDNDPAAQRRGKISKTTGLGRSSSRRGSRKQKYLSLKLELSRRHNARTTEETQKQKKKKKKKSKWTPKRKSNRLSGSAGKKKQERKEEEEDDDGNEKLIDLFPSRSKILIDEDKQGIKESLCYQYETVADYIFNSTPESAISTIQELLDSTATTATTTSIDAQGPLLSPYHHDLDHDHPGSSSSSLLVRSAMRRGERGAEGERWVSYSEVVEEAVSSSTNGGGDPPGNRDTARLSLALKLDYQHIMDAWSDKGPLCVDGEPPQLVPDLHAPEWGNEGGGGGIGGGGTTWVVPDAEGTETWKRGLRENSLRRYKEKRQSRLFSKRIRYEVRKLNAEKRPRIKGRFVRRDEMEKEEA